MQCVRPEDRTPKAVGETTMEDPGLGGEEELPICLEVLLDRASACALPCCHAFHRSCLEGLRSYGTKHVCPMCREELPPGSEQLLEEAG